jgi:hypothetical protein
VHSKSVQSISCISALALLGFVAAGCGSADGKSGIKPLSECELRLENTAAANVVQRAFAAGKLGTADHVAATYFKQDTRSSWLDGSGRLRPLSKLKGDTLFDFEQWMAHIEGTQGKVGDDMFAARMNARHHSTCQSLTR